jgi:hypothetical protein
VTIATDSGSFDSCYWNVPLGGSIEIGFDLNAIPAPDGMAFTFRGEAPSGRRASVNF